MSDRYPGGLIRKTPPTITPPVDGEGGSAPGIWTLEQASYYQGTGEWPKKVFPRQLYAWGRNIIGEIGDGTTINASSPVQVGSESWKAIGSGDNHSLAIKSNGTLWAWGQGDQGQLGQSDIIQRSSPVQIGALTTWSVISAGRDNSFGIKTDGTLWAWGINSDGVLGISSTVKKSSPVQVGALTDWAKIHAGAEATHGIKTDGTAWGWGRGGTYGLIGNGTFNYVSSPVQIGSDTNWKTINCGKLSVQAIKTDGTLYGWGYNLFGDVGNNNTTVYNSPVQIGGLTNWEYVVKGCESLSSLSVKTDDTLWTWGSNQFGRLGDNTTIYRSSPVQVGALTDWYEGSCGATLHCIKNDGTLWSLGAQAYQGSGGTGEASFQNSSPVQVGALTTWAAIVSGEDTPLALFKVTT
jgi:alpha-tubulin suppressor-like RCC1 family protein